MPYCSPFSVFKGRRILFVIKKKLRGIMYMRSFLDSEVYEKNFAYFRLLNMSDLPDNQLYLYGPGDEVSRQEHEQIVGET